MHFIFILLFLDTSDIHRLLVCELTDPARLSCEDHADNKVIHILSALYGRKEKKPVSCHCPEDWFWNKRKCNMNCEKQDSLARVKERCEGQPDCRFIVNNHFFGGDPCHGTRKYLTLTYTCVFKRGMCM